MENNNSEGNGDDMSRLETDACIRLQSQIHDLESYLTTTLEKSPEEMSINYEKKKEAVVALHTDDDLVDMDSVDNIMKRSCIILKLVV